MDQCIYLMDKGKSRTDNDRRTEICYWRKFYRLNNFVAGKLNGKLIRSEQGIYTAALTVEQLEQIRQFIIDPKRLYENDIFESDNYSNMDCETWEKLRDKWDTALKECIYMLNNSDYSNRYTIIYNADW
ncbi:MAG: hypothetical protein MSJ26_08495 [Oscillospiraceae bacterium]|nr:hypothetical protein [Oscillospiraceae bacterium]